MKRATNENMVPKWIADIFKTKKEKRSEQDQADLDRYVADLRFTDPDKYERLQSILKHVDPDTGHLPTGLNTGNIDESVFDDIKASPNKFTNWEYKDPKDPSLGRRIVSKGRNANEAALYVKMRYPEYPNLNPQYFEDTGVRVSLIDRYVEAIYNGETEAPERGEMPYFMRETNNKMKKSNLMEMIREVIAEEMGKVDVVLPGEGVIASVTPEQKKELNGKGFTKKELKAFGIDHEAIRDDIRYKVSGDKSLQLTSILNYIPDNPYSHKKVTENKMKVNQLRQIIREEISKVLNEQTDRIGWDKGFQTSIEFNKELASLLAPYLERGTITKDELEMAADQAGSEGYGEWDRIIGSKSEGPYTIQMFNGKIQISGTKGRDISKNMQSSFDKYGTNLGGK